MILERLESQKNLIELSFLCNEVRSASKWVTTGGGARASHR
jgi:hypothetical protein